MDNDFVPTVACHDQPAFPIVEITDDNPIFVNFTLDLFVWDLSLKCKSQFIDGCPNKKVSIYIAIMLGQPIIDCWRSKVDPSPCKSHCYRAN